MTLAQLADHICGIVNQNETEDLARCKAYLQRRFEMIWNDQLWKDSLFEYTQTLSSSGYTVLSTWLPTRKILLLPTQIQQVVALRTDTVHLNVESSELFYRQDYDTFASTGQTRQYRLLSPAVWEFDTAQTLHSLNQVADNAASLRVLILEDDGTTVTLKTIALSGYDSIGDTLRIDAVTRTAGAGSVLIGVYPVKAVTLVNDTQLPTEFTVDGQTQLLFSGASGFNIPGSQVTVDAGPTTAAIPGGETFLGTITWNGLAFVFSTNQSDVVSLALTDTSALKRQRLQLFGTVPEGAVIRVLGKVKAPTFEADGDEPGLTGVENCLIEFALADMYRRSRQLGKAQLCAQQGAQLLDQLKRVQTVQQAHNKRLIPEGGYNDEYGMNTGGRWGLSF